MRKIFTLLAASAMVLGASAQGYEGNKFFDNWSIGIEGGATTTLTGTEVGTARFQQGNNMNSTTHKAWTNGAFIGGARAVAGAELTKQIIPAFGVAIQDHVIFNWTDSKTIVDVNDLVLLAKVNFMNFFGGYTGTPRVFEIEGVGGAGWRHYYNHGSNYINNALATESNQITDNKDRDSFIFKAGLNLNFNLGAKKAWTIAVKPAVVWDMDGFSHHNSTGASFNINNAQFELTAGVVYHFLSSNGAHHFTKVRPYDQAEVDGLNARINQLRGELADKDGRIADLENQVNELRNRKPQVVEKIVEKTNDKNQLETNVYFQIGKSVIPASQVPSVERVASYLKNHKDSKVTIKGYASKDGPEQLNIKLANNRAAAVKDMLVKKYGVSASRIDAAGNGISEMFSEPEWNRVSICTMDK